MEENQISTKKEQMTRDEMFDEYLAELRNDVPDAFVGVVCQRRSQLDIVSLGGDTHAGGIQSRCGSISETT